MTVPGEHCSSGCATHDHLTLGECLRAKNIGHMHLGGTRPSYTQQKAWTRENDMYRKARKEGLHPAGVSERSVNKAYETAAGGS